MKWKNRLIVIIGNVILLNIANQCFATNMDTIYTKDNEKYLERISYVEQANEEDYFKNLEKEISIDNVKFSYNSSKVENQDKAETIDIETTKTCTLNTNNKAKIVEELENEIEYSEDGFVGKYILDVDNLKIETINNGYYDKLIEYTKEYTGLNKNDLDYIPKKINYNNKTLDLLNTKWEITATENIGNSIIPSEYKAICYYATSERIYRPNNYIIKATYKGTAERKSQEPLKVTITYKESKTEIPEIIEKQENRLPIASGTTIIIVFLGGLLLFGNNLKVYNYQDGKWVYLGKALILNKNVRLNKFSSKEKTNKYRLELSKAQKKRYKDKEIMIIKGKNRIKQIIHNDENMDLEIRI